MQTTFVYEWCRSVAKEHLKSYCAQYLHLRCSKLLSFLQRGSGLPMVWGSFTSYSSCFEICLKRTESLLVSRSSSFSQMDLTFLSLKQNQSQPSLELCCIALICFYSLILISKSPALNMKHSIKSMAYLSLCVKPLRRRLTCDKYFINSKSDKFLAV